MWTTFVNFWDELGWVSNCIEIVSALLIIGLFVYRYNKKRNTVNSFAYKNISELVKNRMPDSDTIKRIIINKSRVAIVDDNRADFPLEYLRCTGFNIDFMEEISLSQYERFAQYDLVLLDIAGVVKEDMENGGLELLRRINGLNKRPQIIAVSSRKFDPKASEFFNVADDVMSKPIKESECEEAIIDLLLQKYSPYNASFYIDKTIRESSINGRNMIALYKIFYKYVYGMIDKEVARKNLYEKYAFMNVDKIIEYLSVIKTSYGEYNA